MPNPFFHTPLQKFTSFWGQSLWNVLISGFSPECAILVTSVLLKLWFLHKLCLYALSDESSPGWVVCILVNCEQKFLLGSHQGLFFQGEPAGCPQLTFCKVNLWCYSYSVIGAVWFGAISIWTYDTTSDNVHTVSKWNLLRLTPHAKILVAESDLISLQVVYSQP